MKKIFTAIFLAGAFAFAKPIVTTTILPTKYFVEKIAADTLEVNVMVVKGADPHTYEPKPSQMAALEKSDIFFAVGLEFDDVWIPRFKKQFKNLDIVLTQDGISKIEMAYHHHHESEHHHEDKSDHKDEHHHEDELDPHIWTDPTLVKIQANNILNALVKKYPQHKTTFEQNYNNFIKELDELHAYALEKLKNFKNKKFIVYHPSWGYFAKQYGLIQIPIEIEGKEPKPKDLEHLIEEAKEEGVKVIFVAPQFSKKSAQSIAKQTGAKVIEIDQLPRDWGNEMKKTIDIFADNL